VLPGAGGYLFTADSCTVEITYPIVALENTLYHAVVTDPERGIAWDGYYDWQLQPVQPETGEETGLPNPASVTCEENGGRVEMRTNENGVAGICVFPDGSECDEWAYYRGECAPEGKRDLLLATYRGISFMYSPTLAREVLGTWVEAAPAMAGDMIPAHREMVFADYLLANVFHQPRLTVYPVADFAEGSASAASATQLRDLLAQRPVDPPSVPKLPLWNAGEMMRAQLAWLDFGDGAGVRYLSQYGQAYLPINNREMFYTYQGLTTDGRYYVALILPVSHPELPPDEMIVGDPQSFVDNYDAFQADVEQWLESQPADAFVPDLNLLDALVTSLLVDPAGDMPTDMAPKPYRNDIYSCMFGYPAELTLDILER
jgi:putative hemolysin